MGILKMVVGFEAANGNPDDDCSNRFHFKTPGQIPTQEDFNRALARLINFYTVVPAAISGVHARSVSTFINNQMLRLATVKGYDAFGSGPPNSQTGSPLFLGDITLDAPGTNDCMPAEVAVNLRWNGNLTGIQEVIPSGEPGPKGDLHPRARRRGRVFIGPLTRESAVSTVGGMVNHTTVDGLALVLKDAALTFLGTDDPADDPLGLALHGVFSKVSGGTWVRSARYTVDNAFDTMRKRGPVHNAFVAGDAG
jgi:hypothetical protein